jgi:hypothetical protein
MCIYSVSLHVVCLFVANEVSRNKVVVPEVRLGEYFRSFLLVGVSFTLNYCAVRFGMIRFC